MKKITPAFIVIAIIVSSGCKKCYQCTYTPNFSGNTITVCEGGMDYYYATHSGNPYDTAGNLFSSCKSEIKSSL